MNSKEKRIYKIDHYYSKNHDKYAIFIETDIDEDSLVKILGCVHFKFEELIDDSRSMDERHLKNVLTRFYGVRDITKECQKYLPYTRLNVKEWGMTTNFHLKGLEQEEVVITQIDWYEARESCCGKHYKELMEKWLPNTKEFDEEIKNTLDFYPWLKQK